MSPLKANSILQSSDSTLRLDGSVCSLIETSDGKFDLKIDGVSHVSWFRRKKYEFMKALGLPKQEQQSKKTIIQEKP